MRKSITGGKRKTRARSALRVGYIEKTIAWGINRHIKVWRVQLMEEYCIHALLESLILGTGFAKGGKIMAEKPIIMSTDSVQKILADIKDMTRRVIKPQPEDINRAWRYRFTKTQPKKNYTTEEFKRELIHNSKYQVGDILWVKETWTESCGMLENVFSGRKINYCADCKPDPYGIFSCDKSWGKKSPIYMPLKLARIFLEVTGVRVERVQDISVEDCIREGFEGVVCGHPNSGQFGCTDCYNSGWLEHPTVNFAFYWDELNRQRDGGAYAWKNNPWVWAITFKRLKNEPA